MDSIRKSWTIPDKYSIVNFHRISKLKNSGTEQEFNDGNGIEASPDQPLGSTAARKQREALPRGVGPVEGGFGWFGETVR